MTSSTAVATVSELSKFLESLKPQLALALPRHMSADRMARLALTAFSSSASMQSCTFRSIASALMTAGQLGLEPGVNGAAFLVPYKDVCTLVPGWKGLVDLVSRSGRATVWTGAVREGDKFKYQLGDTPFCKHNPGDGDGDAPFTHVYAIGRVKDAAMPVIEVWSRAKAAKHLKTYNKIGDRHYATKGENNFEMYARKSALLQVLKYMPSSIELANAIIASYAAEDGHGVTIENGIVIDAEYDDAGEKKVQVDMPKSASKAKSRATQAPATTVAETPAPEEGDPSMTYAQVFDALIKAPTDDARAVAADMIRYVGDEGQRGELTEVYRKMCEPC